MKRKSKIRVAVIGAGYSGKNLIRNYHELGALSLICDTDRQVLEGHLKQYLGVATTDSFNEAFANDNIDAVVISTPAETHYDLVMKSLKAGKAVFVEKPLCLDVEEGKRLERAARGKGLILMVGHLLQYHPAVDALKMLINEGKLGRLQYIYSNSLNLGKIRTEENILWSFAPHDISMILSLTRQMPKEVSSFGSHFLNDKIADVTLSHLSFPSG